MNKKITTLLLVLIALVSCEDKCDHKIVLPPSGGSIVGTWYNELYNEEIRHSESGTFYDKYSNVTHARETEGRYEYNPNTKRLTWTYPFMGETMFTDWKVVELNEFQLVISSTENGQFTYGKVLETYQMNVGETQTIQFETVCPEMIVLSYNSSNERIATVTDEGVIKAEGEKGTAYIKIETTEGDVWAKAIIGDDCLDIWYDYVSLIGVDYKQIRNVLGVPSINGDDGYSYGFRLNMHDLLDEVDVFLNTRTGLVEEIALALKPSVPESQFLSYMDSHYYPFELMGDNYYTTCLTLETSKAVVYYSKETNSIRFIDSNKLLNPEPVELWPDYTQKLGISINELGNEFGTLVYEDNDNKWFSPVDNEYVKYVTFTSDTKSKEIYTVSVFVKESADEDDVIEMLENKYSVFEKGSTEDFLAYINADVLEEATIGITYDLINNLVTYVDLTYDYNGGGDEGGDDVVGSDYVDYSLYLGKTKDDINNEFGSPYMEEGNAMYYILEDGSLISFTVENNSVNIISFMLNESINPDDYIEFLNNTYCYNSDWSTEDEYVFMSHPSFSESSFYVSYSVSLGFVMYSRLNTGYSTRNDNDEIPAALRLIRIRNVMKTY